MTELEQAELSSCCATDRHLLCPGSHGATIPGRAPCTCPHPSHHEGYVEPTIPF